MLNFDGEALTLNGGMRPPYNLGTDFNQPHYFAFNVAAKQLPPHPCSIYVHSGCVHPIKLLCPGPPKGGQGETMTPWSMDFRGPMMGPVGFRGPSRGHMGFRGPSRNDTEKSVCGRPKTSFFLDIT